MVKKFKSPHRFWLAAVWLTIQAAAVGVAHADLIGDLCDANADPTLVIESLVEEAEATGMAPSTLNRLLAVGYRDSESVVDLKLILCTIVILEEKGLPPEPLFEKLEEGLGKRVPLKSIQTAIIIQGEKLQYAQTLLAGGKEPLADDVNVERIADLLDIGVTRDELGRLFGPAFSAPTDMRVVAAEILGYGTISGFPQRELNRVTTTGLKFRSLTPEWSFFIKVIQEARTQGIPDETTASAAVRTLAEKEPMEDLITALKLERKRVYNGTNRN